MWFDSTTSQLRKSNRWKKGSAIEQTVDRVSKRVFYLPADDNRPLRSGMDTILKSFSVGFLLRNLFAGVFFVLACYVATKGGRNTFEINSTNIFPIGLPFALISGLTVYGIHRSILYPLLFEWGFNANWARELRKNCLPLISKNTTENLLNRWDNKSGDRKKRRYERAKQLEVWADYIHLQFASGWCIIFGYMMGSIITSRHHSYRWHQWHHGYHHMQCLVFVVAAIFIIAGAISNWRSHSVEDYAETYFPPPKYK